ncbi:ubiquitin-related modifier 1 [Thamnocephalis sphaerospora]|uniref:Ubiquitin-related modifier 1 n=1 Tax=Thamnocephalis sphaerospora TaxID=78915 RepID=A0A4V1IXH0_9FUNG|nr:ubiquitin-related modifier 1 [Thamnocephalis sphaerospora]|eukprot:RKP11029.1 ubiquitin-related modifier 1 [Thamnocephalis sphaerospora]
MELLFDQQHTVKVQLPAKEGNFSIRELLPWIRDKLLRERPELFMQGDTVRPGVLVLINDVDWELEGELEYQIAEGDRITFISTLHGG